jgi:hypothetical protein
MLDDARKQRKYRRWQLYNAGVVYLQACAVYSPAGLLYYSHRRFF